MPLSLTSVSQNDADSTKKSGAEAWRRKDVVAKLRDDAHGKCMYCEALIDDVSYGAVEHIAPKSVFPRKEADWDNLGYCCPRCNTNKGAYWSDDERLRLLDPYSDPVEDHITWVGPIAVVRNNSSRAENTLRKLKFETRGDLLISRSRKIQELESRIRAWEHEVRPEFKELLSEDVKSALGVDVEFQAVLRCFAELRGFPLVIE